MFKVDNGDTRTSSIGQFNFSWVYLLCLILGYSTSFKILRKYVMDPNIHHTETILYRNML